MASTSKQFKVNVVVCSCSHGSSVKGLIQHIEHHMKDVVETVRFKPLPYNIRDLNKYEFSGIDVLLLCHSIQNRGSTLTNEDGSLYDAFLPNASRKLGKSKVGVIAHDYPEIANSPEVLSSMMDRFCSTQSTTFKRASLVLIGGQLSTDPVQLTKQQLHDLWRFFFPVPSLELERDVLRKWFFQGLFHPHDVMYYKGKYIITDSGHRLITSYHPSTECHDTVCWIPGSWLYGLAPLSDPNMGFLAVDNKKGCVYRIHGAIRPKYNIWATKSLSSPTGITVYNEKVFVANFESHKITVYEESDGKYLRCFGSAYLRRPWFLAVNSKGLLYVTDSQAINVFTTDGVHEQSFKLGIKSITWAYRGIAIDQYDNVYITARDSTAGRSATETVAVLDSKHTLLVHYTHGIDSMNYLRGVCTVHDENKVVVVDGEWHRLKMFKMYT